MSDESMEKEKKHVLIYGTSKSMDANKLIAEMENEKEHVLIYGTSKSMDATVFQWREGIHLRAWMRTN
jgi:hypothetical protein